MTAALHAEALHPFGGTQRNDEARRRLDVCACVLTVWTRDGVDEGALAPRCFGLDAAVDVLEGYVLEASGDADRPSVLRFERTPNAAQFTELLLANLPCVFPWDDRDPLWKACADWHSAGKPVLQALLRAFPAQTGIIAASPSGRTKMTLSQYASWWEHNVAEDGTVLDSETALYLKDLQFCRGPAFTSPRLFEDWLGDCYDARCAAEGCGGAVPDLRFVYVGPAGTLTPLHCDVWQTHSWSANLCGVKLWLFVAPWEAHKLWDRFGGRHASSFADSCFLFPALRSAHVAEVVQNAGEVMFVPSGWFHTVQNETAALSVNANWVRGCGSLRLTLTDTCSNPSQANASNLPHLIAHARSECAASPQGPPLAPLVYTYLSFAAERALRSGAPDEPSAAHMWRLTLARVAHALESWPELADSALDLASRCRAALVSGIQPA